MRRVRAAALLVSLALLAGCSSGGGGGHAAPAAPTTTVAPAASCPALPVPADATDSTILGGDFDGDGRPDRLQTYRLAGGGAWRLRVEIAAGGATETELPATAAGVRALGGVRLDPSPAETALAVVGSSASGDTAASGTVGLYAVRSCRLERVMVGGVPAEFPVRRTATERSGLSCQPPGLLAYGATSADGRFFQATTVGYLLIGTVLDEADRSTAQLGADDPVLPRFGAFSCGGLRL